jgi:hypothetical protein
MNVARPAWQITPFHLRERARLYRFAAALADARGEMAMFQDLAVSFDQLAWQFAGADTRRIHSSGAIRVANER